MFDFADGEPAELVVSWARTSNARPAMGAPDSSRIRPANDRETSRSGENS
jgi:hypothetical protein